MNTVSINIKLIPYNKERLISLRGQLDENLNIIKHKFNTNIYSNNNIFQITGSPINVECASKALKLLYSQTKNNVELNQKMISLELQKLTKSNVNINIKPRSTCIKTPQETIYTKNTNQTKYVHNIFTKDISFGIGPAGTGKTLLAIACAITQIEKKIVNRIVLIRPIIEAGEHLGFLPGNVTQKVDPYLRPLYDALYSMIGVENVLNLLEKQTIEIAPLAYMRGRTLNNAFIILDEGQNATINQMKMLLTRIGLNSKIVITGDTTQIDLPEDKLSGLLHATKILKNIPNISFTIFQIKILLGINWLNI